MFYTVCVIKCITSLVKITIKIIDSPLSLEGLHNLGKQTGNYRVVSLLKMSNISIHLHLYNICVPSLHSGIGKSHEASF